ISPRDPIPQNPRKRRAKAVDPQEQGAGQSQDRVREAELLLQGRKQRIHHLPVRVVQQVADPEEADQYPSLHRLTAIQSRAIMNPPAQSRDRKGADPVSVMVEGIISWGS